MTEQQHVNRMRESWNALSPYYQQHHPIDTQSPHYGVMAPNEDQLQLLGNVTGCSLLELGCGGGQNAVIFARRGARCLGIDLSDRQLDHARALAEMEGVSGRVEFRQGDAIEQLRLIADHSADRYQIVYSAYALQYIGDLERCFVAVHDVLEPEGRFVFSLDHPLSLCTEYDSDTKTVRFTGSYFDSGEDHWDWQEDGMPEAAAMISYLRPVSEIVNAVAGAGLCIDRMLEPEPVDEQISFLHDGDRERYALLPATLIILCHRPK